MEGMGWFGLDGSGPGLRPGARSALAGRTSSDFIFCCCAAWYMSCVVSPNLFELARIVRTTLRAFGVEKVTQDLSTVAICVIQSLKYVREWKVRK